MTGLVPFPFFIIDGTGVPQNDGTKKEDHGKYLSVWRRVGKNWLLAADAWSSDLPVSP
jgi:ketosteroid isomerase-like protein